MPQLARRSVLIGALGLGLALWLVSPFVLGEAEPWDDDGPAYPVALLGQLLVFLGRVVASPETSELWLLGAVILAVYTLVVTSCGVLSGSAIRAWLGSETPSGG